MGRPLPTRGSAKIQRRLEDVRRKVDPLRLEPLHRPRSQAGWDVPPDHLPVVREALLVEAEDVLEDDHAAFHALDFGDVGDLAAAVAEAALVDDDVDGRSNLL